MYIDLRVNTHGAHTWISIWQYSIVKRNIYNIICSNAKQKIVISSVLSGCLHRFSPINKKYVLSACIAFEYLKEILPNFTPVTCTRGLWFCCLVLSIDLLSNTINHARFFIVSYLHCQGTSDYTVFCRLLPQARETEDIFYPKR